MRILQRKKAKRKEKLIMNKKYFYAAVIILSFLVAGIQPAIAIDIPTNTTVGSWDAQTRIYTLTQNVTEGLNIVEDSLTLDGNGHSVMGTGVLNSKGISLEFCRSVTVKNLTVEGFTTGIRLYNYHVSDENKRKGYNTIKDNTISSCGAGINIGASNLNTINNNTVSTCAYGIDLEGSSDNTLTVNTVGSSSEAGIRLIQGFQGGTTVGSNNNMLTSNAVSGSNIGISISSYSNGNSVSGNNVSSNNDGIKIYMNSTNNTLTNNTASSNTRYAIFLHLAGNNILEYNTAKDNIGGIGLYLNASDGNILRNNTSSNNTVLYTPNPQGGHGIRLYDCDNNQIYNNSFIDNTTQASVDGGSGNVFDLGDPALGGEGGNYWSDYGDQGIEDRGDGIGVPAYTFAGGQDNYPLMPTPERAIENLIDKVAELNGEYGISNSLDAKLQNALDALTAKNAGQRQDAINKMQAFINAVEAQSGNKIPVEIADELIADANYIISLL